MNTLKAVGAVLLALSTWGCQSMKPITTVESVDLKSFMGDWYVIAHIPTFIEAEAYNAVESYRLAANGTIETVFRFNQGGLDGPAKVYTPRGLVQERQSNAVWGMQFIWPIKAEYRIIYLAPDYSQTVIGRTRRDYVWIMARQPSIPAEDYARILAFLEEEGYTALVLSLGASPIRPDLPGVDLPAFFRCAPQFGSAKDPSPTWPA